MEKFNSSINTASKIPSNEKWKDIKTLEMLQQPPNWRGELFKKYGEKIFFFIRNQIDRNKLEDVGIEAPKEFIHAMTLSKKAIFEDYSINNIYHLDYLAHQILNSCFTDDVIDYSQLSIQGALNLAIDTTVNFLEPYPNFDDDEEFRDSQENILIENVIRSRL